MTEKIQKVLAFSGFGSRREIEKWIKDGRIAVNKKIAKLGDRIDLSDKVYIDGKLIEKFKHHEKTRVLLYHKPIGEICTRSDPRGRPTPFLNLPKLKNERWIMVGRLDIDTSGLLLFTNNGELANALMHPSSQIDRVYSARIFGEIDQSILISLKKGIIIDGNKMRFIDIKHIGGTGKNHWYQVVLREGRNREVKRLFEHFGFKVSRLIRIKFADIKLPKDLKLKEFRELAETEVNRLKKLKIKKVV